ncbi:hypothetical protein [Microbacterium sp. NPDC056234]
MLEQDNHMFFPGKGRSTMAEYLDPGHLDGAVVDTIIDWLGQRSADRPSI